MFVELNRYVYRLAVAMNTAVRLLTGTEIDSQLFYMQLQRCLPFPAILDRSGNDDHRDLHLQLREPSGGPLAADFRPGHRWMGVVRVVGAVISSQCPSIRITGTCDLHL